MDAACLVLGYGLLLAVKRFPRRPDGKPDLSGIYDIATLTPLSRPAQYGDRLELTDEEAKALSEHWSNNFAKDYKPSDPNRGSTA